jgi:hypothetical protein
MDDEPMKIYPPSPWKGNGVGMSESLRREEPQVKVFRSRATSRRADDSRHGVPQLKKDAMPCRRREKAK